MSRVEHTIEPIWDGESRVLILGTMPSPKSREAGFFYGHPQNRFWRVLGLLFGEEIPAAVDGKRRFLLERKIALWDVLKSCEIKGAGDHSIKNPLANDIAPLLAQSKIATVFTTGAAAARLYQKHLLPQTGLPAIALPSTSPANAACSLEALAEKYRVILNFLPSPAT
ncbi:MAG: DNA-deoxyinosine glycosylase [Clostridiales bacterium]|nr:DNA-deoxyinosine glycosylase [Clostridiales bacterium]